MKPKSKFKVGDIVKMRSNDWFQKNTEQEPNYSQDLMWKKNTKFGLAIRGDLYKKIFETKFKILMIEKLDNYRCPVITLEMENRNVLTVWEVFIERVRSNRQ